MPKIDLGELYKTQVSLTEWFEDLKHSKTDALRLEDNEKRERLGILNKIIKLPYDKPVQFPATALAENTKEFRDYFEKHKDELCALRLIPNIQNLPKLRLRGITISKAMDWFKEQNINPKDYKADFVPHGDNQKWSTIFIVNENGIFGEIIKGGHYQLTQGFYDLGKPITFFYNFKTIKLSKRSTSLNKYLKSIFKLIKVADTKKKSLLKNEFNAIFYNNYLSGYFETVDTKEFGLWFIDYNRVLGDLYKDFVTSPKASSHKNKQITGHTASYGSIKENVRGKVKILNKVDINSFSLEKGDILVCPMTTPDLIKIMKVASAIVTDFGGILSHAAIISRELNIPCIVGTQNATKILKDGDMVEIDTKNASIIII